MEGGSAARPFAGGLCIRPPCPVQTRYVAGRPRGVTFARIAVAGGGESRDTGMCVATLPGRNGLYTQTVTNQRHDETWVNEAQEAWWYARESLRAALQDEWVDAYQLVEALAQRWPHHVPTLVQIWCDAYTMHACDGFTPSALSYQKWTMFNPNTREHVGLGALKTQAPRVQWASNIIMARVGGDRERFQRLFDERPDDPEEYGLYIATVLEAVAATMKTTPRGFAIAWEAFGR
jgi:hypothetical protein